MATIAQNVNKRRARKMKPANFPARKLARQEAAEIRKMTGASVSAKELLDSAQYAAGYASITADALTEACNVRTKKDRRG